MGPSHLFHSSPKTRKHSREQYFIGKKKFKLYLVSIFQEKKMYMGISQWITLLRRNCHGHLVMYSKPASVICPWQHTVWMGPGLAEAEHRLPSAASLICIYKPGVKGKESQIILPHLTNFVEYIKFYIKKKSSISLCFSMHCIPVGSY